ncbi:hypothetical protein L873DRAFT_443940 [Choiromyces venosus 120613-1]|uniref:Uncharacterized protein n=1 Tax=Choiromyces venosus 120613-1 TaxID=1336337 RepID=A0A3N4IZB9_9PEZI|nr:hypothetical protein L873DRAFT_443940 [Choiromyces venosus 120613-1]
MIRYCTRRFFKYSEWQKSGNSRSDYFKNGLAQSTDDVFSKPCVCCYCSARQYEKDRLADWSCALLYASINHHMPRSVRYRTVVLKKERKVAQGRQAGRGICIILLACLLQVQVSYEGG